MKAVLTAAGVVSALGNSATEVWEALLAARSGIGPITGFDASTFACSTAAEVRPLPLQQLGINPKETRIMNTHSFMLMKCAIDAWEGGGLRSLPPDRIGFYAGLGMVDYEVPQILPAVVKSLKPDGDVDDNAFYLGGYREIYPLWPLSMLNNIALSQAAIRLQIKGENVVFSPHADSGAQALIEGVRAVAEGRVLAVVAGGVSEKVTPSSIARGLNMGYLSTGIPSPFGAARSGTILGEGAAMFVIEGLSTAIDRGLAPLAGIYGWGSAFQCGEDFTGPTSEAISAAMTAALTTAELAPRDIDVVIAHGDGTRAADRSEALAINGVFSGSLSDLKVYASKGALGHLLAGAPGLDTFIASCILREGIIPPTVNATPVDSDVGFDLVVDKPAKVQAGRIMINAHSCEGQAVSIIVGSVQM
ncbi:3-oxoacyl-ACP synthase [Candidatus Magnetobacterium bavaricum]|uniref:3-oxoacyl-ACP synthase n=1 Tax=Candidatus Magnetobacterium bavaricum TaxID=29290 RepID=A0A0F3GSW3_9BACT|nr:3-oxoacyl-ACP synthase [Candidatus Magnetobacterium bavaricum]